MFYQKCSPVLDLEGDGNEARVKKKKKEYLKMMPEFKSDLKSIMTSQFACI